MMTAGDSPILAVMVTKVAFGVQIKHDRIGCFVLLVLIPPVLVEPKNSTFSCLDLFHL